MGVYKDKTGKMVEKEVENYIIEFKLNNDLDREIKGECNLIMFLTTKVTEEGSNYKASKTYNLLKEAKLIEAFEKEAKLWASLEADKVSEAFTNFLKDNLVGKKCKVSVINIRDKQTKEEYSLIEKVMRFI